MIRLKTVVCCFIIFLASGCVKQQIAYRLDDVARIQSSSFAPFTLAVAEFKDIRQGPIKENKWYKDDRTTLKDGRDYFFNDPDYYKDKVISPWITEMIVKHIDQAGLFKSTKLLSDNPNTDFILEGNIQRFEGFKEPSIGAQIGQQFGLIGALMTLGLKSTYEGTTILIDVQLKKRSTDEILWTGTAEGRVEGEDFADAYGWSAYQKANESLKVAVNELIDKFMTVSVANFAQPHAAHERVPQDAF
ncbi:MAG: hypothetical protein HZB30_05090 [Nitrospirae bacterium]|nr:hypothetical protein [Nitrospirota bacterium]